MFSFDIFKSVDYLYHMTHVDNLQSIFEKGLLSHNAARNIRVCLSSSPVSLNNFIFKA